MAQSMAHGYKMAENILRFYSFPGLSSGRHAVTLSKLKSASSRLEVTDLSTEICFNASVQGNDGLDDVELKNLLWLLTNSFEEENVRDTSFLDESKSAEGWSGVLIEIGPRLNFSTAWSTNAVSICRSIGLEKIDRIEKSCRYLIQLAPKDKNDSKRVTKDEEKALAAKLHDRMTECRYEKPLASFKIDVRPESCYEVNVMTENRAALEKVNRDLGLAFDDWDLDYYTKLFREQVKRNPTSVECFDLAQSNSEHSRHWFFKGRLTVDGREVEDSLMKMVMKTQATSNNNSVIKFSDNSSAITGYQVPVLLPRDCMQASKFQLKQDCTRHIIFTAETHNFPTGVAPFSGATTGTGGRIRDVQAAGRGAHVVAGTAGYCFGNLHIPGYELPWEDEKFVYPNNMAPPVEIAVEASNGASDYGNKFGEPVLAGFARSFGMMLPNGERREWVKPIMFSGGIGMIDGEGVSKLQPEKGMEVVKVGGPVYRIGVGGGAASSIQVQGDNESELDFGAVQRGDAEMEQKLNRAIRACIEMRSSNPICSIHDQGAGGNGNVLKEISEPAGAVIRVKDFILGDPTISVLELWGAEYQESNALLVHAENRDLLQQICDREKVPVSFVGAITGDGKIVLEDEPDMALNNGLSSKENGVPSKRQRTTTHPVDLELEVVLGKMPRKVFELERIESKLEPLCIQSNLTVKEMLDRVLRLPAVASKRYLTNKVDRSVTGLVAQQQCVGPLHTPVADVAVTALTYFDTVGSATAIGEQPIKGLVDPACGARMAVGEALTNLVFARISDLKDVKCSGNWMWPAKLPGEGATLYDACAAMCDVMASLGIAVDGGKDSLSMAARVVQDTVKSPGSLVISVYAPCPDIRATVTPDLKMPDGKGNLLWVKFGNGSKHRLGGSALAQVYNQLGSEAPDLDDAKIFEAAFRTTQELISQRRILSGHDVSDGGLVTTLMEMAFAGNCGLSIDIPCPQNFSPTVNKVADVLFAEELGIVLEIKEEYTEMVMNAFLSKNVPCLQIGTASGLGEDAVVSVRVGGELVLEHKMVDLRDIWEATSFQLERLQTNPQCVIEEEAGLSKRHAPEYKLSFEPAPSSPLSDKHPKVAIIREEGSNGDREMVASFHMAGFEAWDVTMNDLCSGSVKLVDFRGAVFVGGFSYADVLGSAKGWAAVCNINATVRSQLDAFFSREDTFSLGVCNGCQLMGLLGWVGQDTQTEGRDDSKQGVCFTHNTSERFESRFVTVSIQSSPAMMLRGMEGSVLGIWVAHGEGRIQFRSDSVLQNIKANNLVPLCFVDEDGLPTTQYPLNPNGSPEGIAGLCSPDGRHLAMMPHPERCTLLWQLPWMPLDWQDTLKASPWLQMFHNAYRWCVETSADS